MLQGRRCSSPASARSRTRHRARGGERIMQTGSLGPVLGAQALESSATLAPNVFLVCKNGQGEIDGIIHRSTSSARCCSECRGERGRRNMEAIRLLETGPAIIHGAAGGGTSAMEREEGEGGDERKKKAKGILVHKF
ncbi:hypothetical protein PVAP13_9NG713514 [Panicum virgatum]|uniref:Uncharacterized protein n=1 Tax=Panicum virgatum TaxID=38727 RepID=A0A8T0MXP6_PANVG|nr:hypothetical protein PVAP13_9NG713514 [Panicum virgatum]